MTILEVRRFLKENPDGKVFNPSGFEYSADQFFGERHWPDDYVFSNGWKVKREPRVIWVNEFRNSSITHLYLSKAAADLSAGPERTACVKFVEVIE